jgi:hypothetical protein
MLAREKIGPQDRPVSRNSSGSGRNDKLTPFLLVSLHAKDLYAEKDIFFELCGQMRASMLRTTSTRCSASATAIALSAGRVIADAKVETRMMDLELLLRRKGDA